jgi:hypothetical protein
VLTAILKELAREAGRGAVTAIGSALGKLLRRATSPDEAPPQPLSHRDVEHQQEQIRRATSKRTGKPGGGA